METKEIEIEWKGEKKIVKIRKLGYGQLNELKEKCIETKMDERDIASVVMHPFLMRTLSLQACITEAPFGRDIGSINELDPDIGEMLFREIDEFNSITLKKNVSSSTQSSQESSETPKQAEN